MPKSLRESQLISIFQTLGFNENESYVYLTLINSGEKGSIVKQLDHKLSIKRTNIYNILKKLIVMGCVKEGGQAKKAKNATIYIAMEPKLYLHNLIKKKQDELNELQEIQVNYSEILQSIFHQGLEITIDELDNEIQEYFRPLIEKGWRIKSYTIREEILNYKVYDCILKAPQAKTSQECSFHLFIFGYNIEEDKTAMEFFTKNLKRKTKEMKAFSFNAEYLQLIDGKVRILNKELVCFKILDNNTDIGKAILLPRKEKLFYLSAESDNILKEILKPIFKIEGIS
ncbi:MAG: helix-turn-helix domain-containing protein [Promethearchaeota archaeon]